MPTPLMETSRGRMLWRLDNGRLALTDCGQRPDAGVLHPPTREDIARYLEGVDEIRAHRGLPPLSQAAREERFASAITAEIKPRARKAKRADWSRRAQVDAQIADAVRAGGSAYFELGGLSVRISDHARQSHHAANYIHGAPDAQILVLTEEQAAAYEAWRAEAPRAVSPAAVVIRRPRMRVATIVREVRTALAAAIRAARATN